MTCVTESLVKDCDNSSPQHRHVVDEEIGKLLWKKLKMNYSVLLEMKEKRPDFIEH